MNNPNRVNHSLRVRHEIDQTEVEWYAGKFMDKMNGCDARIRREWIAGTGCNAATCVAINQEIKRIKMDGR